MVKPDSLREPSNEECKNHDLYNRYYYQALGFLSGRSSTAMDYNSAGWPYSIEWCAFYASYMVRSALHDLVPIGIVLVWAAFQGFEIPNIERNEQSTLIPCEVDNG